MGKYCYLPTFFRSSAQNPSCLAKRARAQKTKMNIATTTIMMIVRVYPPYGIGVQYMAMPDVRINIKAAMYNSL